MITGMSMIIDTTPNAGLERHPDGSWTLTTSDPTFADLPEGAMASIVCALPDGDLLAADGVIVAIGIDQVVICGPLGF